MAALVFAGSFYFTSASGVVSIDIQNNTGLNISLFPGINTITFIGTVDDSLNINCCSNICCTSKVIFFQNLGNLLIENFGTVTPNFMLSEADVVVMQRFQREQYQLQLAELKPAGRLISEVLQSRLTNLLGIRFRIFAAASNNDTTDVVSNLSDVLAREPIATAVVTVTGNGPSLVLTAKLISDRDFDAQVLVPANSLWVSINRNETASPIEVFSFGTFV